MQEKFIQLKAHIPIRGYLCPVAIRYDRLYFSSGLIQKTEEFVREIWKALFVLAAGVCSYLNLQSDETFTVSLQVGPQDLRFKLPIDVVSFQKDLRSGEGRWAWADIAGEWRVEVLSKVREAVLEVLCNEGFIQ